jgi:hypothetical protein
MFPTKAMNMRATFLTHLILDLITLIFGEDLIM